MQTAEDIKAFSLKVIDISPDDPKDAIVALALTYACCAWGAGLDDERAIEAVRRALRQMRELSGGDEFIPFHPSH